MNATLQYSCHMQAMHYANACSGLAGFMESHIVSLTLNALCYTPKARVQA